MSPEDLDRLLALDPAWRDQMHRQWLRLMELAVWGDLKAVEAGALARLRRRTLDLGERWRSFFNPRDWIPQPRERLKNALASALAVRTSLAQLEEAAGALQVGGGADHAEWQRLIESQRRHVEGRLQALANEWAAVLEALNRAGREP